MASPGSTTALQQAPPLPEVFGRYRDAISAHLRDALDREDVGIYGVHRYHMGWEDSAGKNVVATEGKRLRPTLVMLTADAFGGDLDLAVRVASAIEFVHNFSLIHDDIQDHDRFRHHRSTAWVVWGQPRALTSGNAMLKVADLALTSIRELDRGRSRALSLHREMARACLRMIEGQYLDIYFERRTDISLEQYLALIDRKTGALIQCSTYLGALVSRQAAGDHLSAEQARRMGSQLGRVFQIMDDVLGVWGKDETGKPVGGDILNRKKSLPAVHALTCGNSPAARRMREIYRQKTVDVNDVDEVLGIMNDVGTRRYCEAMARRHGKNAEQIIRELPIDAQFRRDFQELTEFLLLRQG